MTELTYRASYYCTTLQQQQMMNRMQEEPYIATVAAAYQYKSQLPKL